MALIECSECGNMISNQATECPNCRLPLPKNELNNETTNTNISIEKFNNVLKSFLYDYEKIFSQNEYISTSQKKNTFKRYYEYFNKFISNKESFNKIKENCADMRIDYKLLMDFASKMRKLDSTIDEFNESYVESALINNKEYFDNILKAVDENIILDDEQRRAVITDDDHCLLIAGAGAGKTTTMAAKVKWLVDKKNINPSEIMLISYTNKAIEELKDRVNKKLNIPAKISTFHSFAFDIVKNSVDRRPEVNFSSYKIISEMIEEKLFSDKEFLRNMILFLGCYFNVPDEALKFKSLDEYHLYKSNQDYNFLKNDLGKYVETVGNTRSKHQMTLQGKRLRSSSEVQIANFLYLNGIDFEYEKIYPHRIAYAKKEYTPDFYIFQDGKEAYIEHYALNQDFSSRLFNASEIYRYKKAIEDKRKLHSKFSTTLIETWNRYDDGSDLLENLKEELIKNGFEIRPKNLDEVYSDIVNTSKDKYIFKFVRFMIEFIEHYKSEGFNDNGFDKLRKRTDNVRTLLFLDLAEECFKHYQKVLEERNQIDFADMINDGAKYLDKLAKNDIKLPYKYIIIDEFQDIATQRFNFTKKLAEITGAKVVAVGDDWQSIYAFAGSDITLFTRFLDLMGDGKELQITHTYRNSQELIDIAGGFIQKNTNQIKKQLVSPKHLEEPIKINAYDDSFQIMNNLAERTTEVIGKIIEEYGIESSILLIGRYNFDARKLTNTPYFDMKVTSKGEILNDKIICKKYPKANLTFMTAHSSKGLGFDNVILINMLEGKFGFPSQVANDPIMKLVIHEDTTISFAEERRLLYVALTRTKNRVYIVAPRVRPSRFLIELINDYKLKFDGKINMDIVRLYTKRCPVCGYPLKEEYNGRLGLKLWICTNEPELCDFMTNSETVMKDIFKCYICGGYMIVKKKKDKEEYFYGCTNYMDGKGCLNTMGFDEVK